MQERTGWLEVCPPLGTVFLDEIAEVESAIQAKLLRVLQNCTFSRVGDTVVRPFKGKLIAATRRDLAVEIEARRFREDFYYRLAAKATRVFLRLTAAPKYFAPTAKPRLYTEGRRGPGRGRAGRRHRGPRDLQREELRDVATAILQADGSSIVDTKRFPELTARLGHAGGRANSVEESGRQPVVLGLTRVSDVAA